MRFNGKDEMLKKVDSIVVHRKCWETYTYTLKRNNVLCYKDLGTLSNKKSKVFLSPAKSKVKKNTEFLIFKNVV